MSRAATNASESTRREALPMVFVVRPRCPHCGGLKFTTKRSHAQGDGSTLRDTRCQSCNQRFLVVIEPEEISANSQFLAK